MTDFLGATAEPRLHTVVNVWCMEMAVAVFFMTPAFGINAFL